MALRILMYKNKLDSDLVWQTQLIQLLKIRQKLWGTQYEFVT